MKDLDRAFLIPAILAIGITFVKVTNIYFISPKTKSFFAIRA